MITSVCCMYPLQLQGTLGTVVAREIPAWEILKVVRSIRAGFSFFLLQNPHYIAWSSYIYHHTPFER